VFITGLGQVFAPRILGFIIDHLKGNKIPFVLIQSSEKGTFIFLFSIFVATLLIIFIGRICWRKTLARQTHLSLSWLRRKIWDNACYLPKEKLDKEYTIGNLMNASTSDAREGSFIFGFTQVALFDVLFRGVISVFFMLTISVDLTLWTLSLFLIIPFFVKKLAHLEAITYESAQESLSQFNEQSSSAISTVRLQRITQADNFWRSKLEDSASDYKDKKLKAIFTSLRFLPLMGIGALFSYGVLFYLGLKKVFVGQISIGDFVALQSYVILIQDPLMELGYIISELQRSMTSLKRLFTIYDEKKDSGMMLKGSSVNDYEVIFNVKKISFKFDDSSSRLINDLSFTLNSRERLGILGPIGSGKSTLLNILAGLERNYQGEIFFNNGPLEKYSHESLRSYISIVPQKTFLFADSIRNNIALNKSLTEQQIWHYLYLAGIDEDISKLPSKLDTQLGEWGINLSGGQKQRLTLARALSNDPKLLLLDDCLSAVDTVTEEKILKNLDKYLEKTTLVWVAHRKSTLKYCDKILDLSV